MNIKEIQADLKPLKDGIEEADKALSRLDGQESEILKQLKSKCGISSEEEAIKKRDQLTKEKEKLEKEIQAEYTSLKSEYDW